MAEVELLAELELVVRLVVVLVHVLQEVRLQGRQEWMRKIGVDHNICSEDLHSQPLQPFLYVVLPFFQRLLVPFAQLHLPLQRGNPSSDVSTVAHW